MFDVWLDDINLFVQTLMFDAVILPVQLLLCFKVKNLAIRLLPVIILSVLTIVFIIGAISTSGWDELGCSIPAFLTSSMLPMCGLG